MTPAIVIITTIMIIASIIAGFIITREHRNAILGVFTTLGGTVVSIAAAVIFSNYEPVATADNTASDTDMSTLDSVHMLFAEAFTVLIATVPVLLITCIFGAAMHFTKDPLEQ